MPRAPQNPTDIAAKQIRRVQGATEDVVNGINRVTESPTEAAAKNLDKAAMNYKKAIDSGKMERNLRAVSLADWKEAAVAKVDRIGPGIEAARPKLEMFHGQLQKHQDGINRELASIPTKTIADSERRMIAQMKGMAKFSFLRDRS